VATSWPRSNNGLRSVFCICELLDLNLGCVSRRRGGKPRMKNNPFMARGGACPSAPSRAPGCGVHWSEAETLARKERTDQAQGLARKGWGNWISSNSQRTNSSHAFLGKGTIREMYAHESVSAASICEAAFWM